MKQIRLCTAILYCCLILICPSAAATSPESQALASLETSINGMIAIIQDPALQSARENQRRQLLGKAMAIFDFKTFSMLSLGRKYRQFSPDQQARFEDYFSRLISKTYTARLEGQNVDNLRIEYLENVPLKPKKNILRTDISTRILQGETAIPVVYRMIKKQDLDWKIYDLKIEGVSMAANYRDQYRQNLSDSPEKIINALKEKLEK